MNLTLPLYEHAQKELSLWSTVLLEKKTVVRLVKKSTMLIKDTAIRSYPEPNESSSQPHIDAEIVYRIKQSVDY
jgi:hypothetical protein